MAKGTVNKVILLGRLGRDPESRSTAGGEQVCMLSLATNEFGPRDGEGNHTDVTEWHRVVLFGKVAAIALQYLEKGSLAYVEGRLRTRKWQDQHGNDRYTTEIVGRELQFVGGRSGSDNSQQPSSPPPAPAQPSTTGAGSNFDDFDDDIPF